jgi:uncharacterized membrane protein YkvA (DUF1232 family)
VSDKRSLRDPARTASWLAEMLKQGRLILRLLGDRRVPIWPKLIIPATVAYIVSPIDLLMDPMLGLGQLDDVAVLLIGLKLFVELCPTEIVRQHLEQLSSVVEGTYRVVKEDHPESGDAQNQLSQPERELPAGETEQS